MTLIEAIKQNNQAEFFRLLNLQLDPSGTRVIDEIDGENGGNALHVAAAYGHLHFIAPLFSAGIDFNEPDNDGWTAAYIAAESGYAGIVTALKAGGADVGIPNNDGVTPVYAAAENGHAAAITALGTAGANMDAPNTDGFTPICIIIQMGDVAAMTALLEAGANASLKTPQGTFLEQAKEQAEQSKTSEFQEVVRLLEAHLKQYPNGIKAQMVVNKKAVLPAKPSLSEKQKNPPAISKDKPTFQNNLDSSLLGLNLQVSIFSPVARQNAAVKNELYQKAHQVVEDFSAEPHRYDNPNVEAKAGRDVITVAGGIRGQGEMSIGGGNNSSFAGASPNSSDSNPKEAIGVDNIAVLKQLKLFFMSNKYKGLESPDCELYNRALDSHKAMLVYIEEERVHRLFLNDESLESQNAIKMLSKMIASFQPLNTQNTNTRLNSARVIISSGNTQVQARAERDVITITGGVTSGGGLHIGSGDTHYSFTAYNQFKNQTAGQYNITSVVNNSGNMQLGNGNMQNNKSITLP